MPPPKHRHYDIQRRLLHLLGPIAAGHGVVGTEFGFRPVTEHEFWLADVVFVSQARYDAIDPEDNFHGVPELVIEVLSPSNTVSEIGEKEAMCLEHGCLEFWIVDPKRQTVKVSTPDRKTIAYVRGDRIPLHILHDGELAVSDIFD